MDSTAPASTVVPTFRELCSAVVQHAKSGRSSGLRTALQAAHAAVSCSKAHAEPAGEVTSSSALTAAINQAIGYAAQRGHITAVRALCEFGADPSVGHMAPLRYAARNGHKAVLQLLLGATSTQADDRMQMLNIILSEAVQHSQLAVVRLLLEQPSVSGQGPLNAHNLPTLLKLAVQRGWSDVVCVLLRYRIRQSVPLAASQWAEVMQSAVGDASGQMFQLLLHAAFDCRSLEGAWAPSDRDFICTMITICYAGRGVPAVSLLCVPGAPLYPMHCLADTAPALRRVDATIAQHTALQIWNGSGYFPRCALCSSGALPCLLQRTPRRNLLLHRAAARAAS